MNFDTITAQLELALSHLDERMKAGRTGRAQPELIEGVKIEVYGTVMDIKSLASVTVPDARTLLIDPWDKSTVPLIEQSLRESSLGFNPLSDGKVLRIVVPQPTEETRKEMVKLMRAMTEDARISFRHIRDEAKNFIIEREKKGEIGQDERFRLQEQLDALIKKYNDMVELRARVKEEEIMTV